MTTIPFLQDAFLHAYNARRANFMGSPIFNFTFNDGGKIVYNNIQYDVPDQLAIGVISKQIQNQQTMSLKNENEYDSLFSAEVKGEYSGVTFKGSAYSNLTFKGSLFTSTEVEYSINRLVYQTYTAQRNVYTNCLNQTFLNDLANLPNTIEGNFKQFIAFFDLYGTHFLYNGNFGATIFMQTSAEKSLLKKYSAAEIKAGITAGFNGAVASGSLGVSSVYSNSDLLNQNQSSFNLYFESFGGKLTQDLTKFQDSVAGQPVLLLTSFGALSPAQFTPISMLCTDAAKAALIDDAIQSYLLISDSQDGLISLPSGIDANVSKNMINDSIVLTRLWELHSPAREQSIIEDGTLTCVASIHYSPAIKALIPAASGAIPARQSTAIQYNGPANTSETSFFSISDPNNPIFGDWTPIVAGLSKQAETNGFLFAGLSNATDSSYGTVVVSVGDLGLPPTDVAGCSVFMNKSNLQIPGNSTCYPLVKGQFFQVTESLVGQISTSYQFIAMDELISSLGKASPRSLDTQYTASGDGFLVSFIKAPDGSFGTLHTDVNLDGGDVSDVVAGASVYHNSKVNVALPFNSTFLPIPKGSTYRIAFDKTLPYGGKPIVASYWFDYFPANETYDMESILEQERKLSLLKLVH